MYKDQSKEARALILSELPGIPSRDLSRLIPEVVRQAAQDFGEFTGKKVRNIAAAYVRHTYTNYDKILQAEKQQLYGESWSQARSIIQPAVTELLSKWERAAI